MDDVAGFDEDVYKKNPPMKNANTIVTIKVSIFQFFVWNDGFQTRDGQKKVPGFF